MKPEGKVVFLSPFSSEAASSMRMIKLSESFKEKNLLMPLTDRYGKSRELTGAVFVAASKINFLKYFLDSYNSICNLKPDVVYFLKPNPYSFIPALTYKIIHRIKLVFDCDEWEPYTIRDNKAGFIKENMIDLLTALAVCFSDCIVISNQKIKELISQKYRYKLVYIPNGVDTSLFKPNFGKEDKSFVIQYVGSLYKLEQIKPILNSVDAVLKEIPSSEFVFTGPGDMEQLKKYEKNRVKFTGGMLHSEIPKVLSKAGILLATFPKMKSIEYASNMKLFEYMASGRPILAFEVGEIKEILDNGNAGYVIKDGASLKDSIKEIYDNYDNALSKAKKARDLAVEKYDWNVLSGKLKNAIEKLCT